MDKTHKITMLGTGLIGMFYTMTLHSQRSRDRVLTQHPETNSWPTWSRNGKHIAFASNVTRLTHDDTNRPPFDWAPAWSPDGRLIAFQSTRGGRGSDIWLMNPDGTNLTQLAKHPGHDTAPAWSPDGEQIAFSSDRDGNFDIYVMNPDGEQVVRLTDDPATDFTSSWFPSTLGVSPKEKLPTLWADVRNRQ